MNALSSEPPDMPPEGFGLLRNEATQILSPATVPRGVTMAPDNILKFIKCQCESEIIIKSLDPLRAKKTFIRKKLGHTMVSAIKASSVTV